MKQEIPWNRFAVEAIVIVGSILLAFAIDAWWDSRQDDSRRDKLLLQLESSFTNHINQAEIAIRVATRSSENIRSFILSSPDELELVTGDETYEILADIWRPSGLQQGLLDSRSIIAILNSNSLTLATDPDLLSALREWQGELETLQERVNDVLASSKDAIEAMSVFPEIQKLFATPFNERIVSSSVLRKVRENENIMQQAAVRISFMTFHLISLERVHDRANIVLDLIR